MKAHVFDNRLIRFYADSEPLPSSYKGEMVDVIRDVEPAYDPATEKLDEAPIDLSQRPITIHWVRRKLTAEELAARADAEETRAIRLVLENMKAGEGTVAVRLARVERVLYAVARQNRD